MSSRGSPRCQYQQRNRRQKQSQRCFPGVMTDPYLHTHVFAASPSIPAQNLQGVLPPTRPPRVPGMPASLRCALRNAGSPRGWDEARGLLEASAPRLPSASPEL